MKSYRKYIGLLILPFCITMVSCDDKDKVLDVSNETVIYDIKIVNGGLKGDSTILGTVDEVRKEISFPRVHTNTDLSAIRFEGKLSEGATFDAPSYDFVIPSGDAERERVIAVVNGLRKREYFAKIRWDVLVFGADFSKGIPFDYSVNPKSKGVYPDFSGSATRSSDFDGEHALFVSRSGGVNPHLLTLEDIKNDNVTNKIKLKLTDDAGQTVVAGGTFPISSGRLAQGHIYVCNLASGTAASQLRVYHWDSPTSSAKLLYTNGTINSAGAGRYGDNMSMHLNESGDGFMFFENNSTNKILKVEIKNFSTIGDESEIYPKGSTGEAGGQYSAFNKIEGSNLYLYTGYESSVMLVTETGSLEAKLSSEVVPQRASDAKIFTYNKERYLIVTIANRRAGDATTAVQVYDITKGESLKEAFAILEAAKSKPVFTHSLGGDSSTAPGSNTGWGVVDGKLYIYGASDNSGFVVCELSEKTQD